MNRIYEELKEHLRNMGSVAVAFSGGVDSTLLLKAATDALGDKAAGIMVVSALIPEREQVLARRMAETHRVHFIELDEAFMADFAHNPPERCYLCKKKVFTRIQEEAGRLGLEVVVDGTNVDDKGDFRPGKRALKELGVRSPFSELGIGKETIRALSKELGLGTWNLPSMACLASRIPYGERLTGDKLKQVEKAEELLHGLGFVQGRVRHHGDLARIEVPEGDLAKALGCREAFVEELKGLGFRYVTLDLLGYRTGSMNEALSSDVIKESLEGKVER